MILVEGHWEKINNLYDISRVIREYYNPELANEMDELIEQNSIDNDDLRRLEDLENLIEEIRMLVG